MRTSTFLFLLSTASCVQMMQQQPSTQSYARAQANANAQVDGVMKRRIEQARDMARIGGAKEVWTFGKEVENAYHAKVVERGSVDGPALVQEAIADFERVAKESSGDAPQMLAGKGSLLIVAGRPDEGRKALEASLEAGPSLWPVAKLLEIHDGQASDVFAICRKVRPAAKNDDERFALLDRCAHHSKIATLDAALAWTNKDDIVFYKKMRAEEDARVAQENAAYRQKQEEDRQKLYASFSKPEERRPSAGSSSPPPQSAGPVSVTIRSRCSKTVRVFYGDNPKFGSGTQSSISSNSSQSHSFRVGEQMWIIDDHDNGLASAQVSSSTREIEIGASCTGLMTH
jgi:hypothetical protein